MKPPRHVSRILAALVLLVGIHASAWAGDFEDALAAAQSGDFETALRLWKPLAEQGDAGAQYNLGIMYDEGRGVPLDDMEAAKWYRLAAEQGDDHAQYNLGYMYAKGEGVPQDYVQAHMWFNLSAAQGNENAVKGRDLVASEMTPAQIEEAQRLAREWIEAHPQ